VKVTQRTFVIEYIRANKGKYPGVHAVYGGLNSAFRKQFPDADPIAVIDRLRENKVLMGSRKDRRYLLVTADMPTLPGKVKKTASKSKADIGLANTLAAIAAKG
jgi:hypothetical protein